jgi:hypothetical protein
MLGNVVVPEPKLSHAARAQPRGAPLIAVLLWQLTVLAAIKLDRQPQLRTVEIQNVRSGGVLPPKFEPIETTGSEPTPQPRPHSRRILAQTSRAFRFFARPIVFRVAGSPPGPTLAVLLSGEVKKEVAPILVQFLSRL